MVLSAVGAHQVVEVLEVLVPSDGKARSPNLLLYQVGVAAGCASSLRLKVSKVCAQ